MDHSPFEECWVVTTRPSGSDADISAVESSQNPPKGPTPRLANPYPLFWSGLSGRERDRIGHHTFPTGEDDDHVEGVGPGFSDVHIEHPGII